MIRTRFAPSPTGYMHLGNLRTALYTWLFARHTGGQFLLRIEDTDQQREVEGAVDVIYRTLRFVGIDWDEGPDIGGNCGPYIQSQRRDLYAQYAQELVERGGAYYCFCTRDELEQRRTACEARGDTFKYDKRCLHLPAGEVRRRLAAGEPYVIRQNMPVSGTAGFDDALFGRIQADYATLDDTVLLKADGLPTYNFANVVDDHLMGITHVLRGSEYLSSTPKYNHLYECFGWQKPVYVHLSPVMADAHRKLSKRKGDPSFEDLLEQGYLKEAIVNYIALLGWNPGTNQELFTLTELVQAFSLEGLSKSPAIFDKEKLRWFNAQYARALPADEYHARMMQWVTRTHDLSGFDTGRIAQLLQPRTEVFTELAPMLDFLFALPDYPLEYYDNKRQKSTADAAPAVLADMQALLAALPDWTEDAIRDAVMAYITQKGIKNGQVLWPLRIAISGCLNTPGGAFEVAYLLGKAQTLARLSASMDRLTQSG